MARAAPRPLNELLPHAILSELMRISTEDLSVRPMMGRIARALADHFDWPFVAIVSIDREGGRFVCEGVHTQLKTEVVPGYSRPLGSGVVGEVAATGRAVLVSDATTHPNFVQTLSGAMSELCVPVIHRGELLAVLNIEGLRAREFDGKLPLLEVIAGHIAGAIAAAQRVEALHGQSELLRLVADFTRRALEAEDLDSLLAYVLEFLGQRFNALEATVLLDSDLRDHLEVFAHRGASSHISYRGKQWPIGNGVVGRCYRNGEVVYVADVRLEPDYVVVNADVVAEMAVPIRLRDRVFGVLNLEAAHASAFAEHQRLILTALADQVAGAIHMFAVNRRLLQSQKQSERRGEELTTAREHLRRAVVRLDRRGQREQHGNCLTASAMRRQLIAELRAVARGGRALMMAMIVPGPEACDDDPDQAWLSAIVNALPDAPCHLDSQGRLNLALAITPERSIEHCVRTLREALEGAGTHPFAGRAVLMQVTAGTVTDADALLLAIDAYWKLPLAIDAPTVVALVYESTAGGQSKTRRNARR